MNKKEFNQISKRLVTPPPTRNRSSAATDCVRAFEGAITTARANGKTWLQFTGDLGDAASFTADSLRQAWTKHCVPMPRRKRESASGKKSVSPTKPGTDKVLVAVSTPASGDERTQFNDLFSARTDTLSDI